MTDQHTKQELSIFKKVESLRDIWPKEDENFTPWLAENENISQLGDALDLELKDPQREVPVGTFSLDVLAIEAETDRYVVIENQLGQADHRHLGQLITYTAEFNPKIAVWIAKGFNEKHRAAVELLNNTSTDTEFFGVRIEAWTIDDSRPAPRFHVVVAPNGWPKDEKSSTHGKRGSQYREFFQPLVDTLRGVHNFTNRTIARGKSSESFTSSHPALTYRSSFFDSGAKKHRIELFINHEAKALNHEELKALNEEIYDKLYEQKQDIESDLGNSHNWHWQRSDDERPGVRTCRISVAKEGGIDDENKHDDIRKWMVDHLLKFKEVFDTRLAELAEQGIL